MFRVIDSLPCVGYFPSWALLQPLFIQGLQNTYKPVPVDFRKPATKRNTNYLLWFSDC